MNVSTQFTDWPRSDQNEIKAASQENYLWATTSNEMDQHIHSFSLIGAKAVSCIESIGPQNYQADGKALINYADAQANLKLCWLCGH